MKHYTLIFVLLLTCIFFSCKKKTEPISSPENISLVIGNPVDIKLKDMLLFPVGVNYNPAITEKKDAAKLSDTKTSKSYITRNTSTQYYDVGASEEYINGSEEEFDIRNILFYNKITGSTYPLLNDTAHILSFAIHYEYKKPLIFFRIVKKDINADKKFNKADAVILYISDINGKNLVQTTPENEQFFDYFYYSETNTILVKTAIDADNDKQFTTLDETNFREIRLDSVKFGKEIFTQNLKDSLKSLMK